MDMLQRAAPRRPLLATRQAVASDSARRATSLLLQHDRPVVGHPGLHWNGDAHSGRHLQRAAVSDGAKRAVHLPAVHWNPSELLRLPPALKLGVNLAERPR